MNWGEVLPRWLLFKLFCHRVSSSSSSSPPFFGSKLKCTGLKERRFFLEIAAIDSFISFNSACSASSCFSYLSRSLAFLYSSSTRRLSLHSLFSLCFVGRPISWSEQKVDRSCLQREDRSSSTQETLQETHFGDEEFAGVAAGFNLQTLLFTLFQQII